MDRPRSSARHSPAGMNTPPTKTRPPQSNRPPPKMTVLLQSNRPPPVHNPLEEWGEIARHNEKRPRVISPGAPCRASPSTDVPESIVRKRRVRRKGYASENRRVRRHDGHRPCCAIFMSSSEIGERHEKNATLLGTYSKTISKLHEPRVHDQTQ